MKNILWVTLIFGFVSCHSRDNKTQFLKERLKSITKEYTNEKKEFVLSKQMMSHFPERVDNLPFKIITNLDEKKSEVGVKIFTALTFDIDKKNIDSLKKTILQDVNITRKSATDNTLKILDVKADCGDYIHFFDSNSKYDNPEEIVKKEDVYAEETKSGLTKEFTIYFIESRPLSKKEIQKASDGKIGRDVNCFSRGVAINEKKNIIIYWIFIW